MQLYEVAFQVHYEDIIDAGKAIVCAADKDEAVERVSFLLDLPGSQTVFDVARLKPNIFQVDRKEIHKHLSARSRNAGLAPKGRFVVTVTAGVRAANETNAFRKLAHTILARCASDKAIVDKDVTELESSCERMGGHARGPALEKQAVYKEHTFYQGGMARPR